MTFVYMQDANSAPSGQDTRWEDHAMPVGDEWTRVNVATGQLQGQLVVQEGSGTIALLPVPRAEALPERCSLSFLVPGLGTETPVTFFGSPTAYRNDLRVAQGAAVHSWLPHLAAFLHEKAQEDLCVIPYVTSHTASLFQDMGAEIGLVDVEMVVRDVSRRPSHLSSHRLQRLEAEKRKLAGAGYLVRSSALSEANLEVAARLIQQQNLRYSARVRSETDYREYLELLADSGSWTIFQLQDELQSVHACAITIVHHDDVYVRMYGSVEAGSAAGGAYFATCIDAPVEYARLTGLANVRLGQSAYQAKWNRGATGEALWTAVFAPPTMKEQVRIGLAARECHLMNEIAEIPALRASMEDRRSAGPQEHTSPLLSTQPRHFEIGFRRHGGSGI